MSPDAVLKKHFWAVTLGLVGVAAYFQAAGITQIVGTSLSVDDKAFVQGGPLSKPAAAQAASTSRHTTSANRIIERNPFDSETGNLSPPPSASLLDVGGPPPAATDDPYSVPDCGDGIKIVATAVSDDAAWSLAILSGGTGMGTVTHLRRQSEDYAGKKVWFVRWDRVWLIAPGQLCQIEMFPMRGKPAPSSNAAAAASAARGGTAPTVPDEIKKGIKQVSATEYNVDRAVIDKVLENQAVLMRSARIVPEQENGKTVGVRLFGIKSDSLLGTIGMENGDRLEKINGFDMASPEKALEAYARLRTADKLTVTINRKGQSMNLDYHIK